MWVYDADNVLKIILQNPATQEFLSWPWNTIVTWFKRPQYVTSHIFTKIITETKALEAI